MICSEIRTVNKMYLKDIRRYFQKLAISDKIVVPFHNLFVLKKKKKYVYFTFIFNQYLRISFHYFIFSNLFFSNLELKCYKDRV